MTANSSERSKELMDRLAVLKERSYDVKFDIEGSDYTAVENIGIGAYGVVCSAIHNKTHDRVAIKKIHKAFDFDKIATRTYREIKILKHFKHDNIISIRDILKPKGSVKDFKDIYIVLDLMESDLHRIIYSKQELTEEHVRYFLYQLLRGLKYIHSGKVIHRDLKPSNLLVNEDCQLRIGDFGMARGLSSNPEEPNHFMTQYVATRWYRAPEIMLSMVEYGSAVDMWSVGCIFAEMLGRRHLFPGKDYIQQIKYIIGVLGSPSQVVMDLCNSDIIKSFVNQLGKKDGIAWTTLFPKASRKAINLLSHMLVLHPGERINVEDALKHHYLSKYHDPDDEPICVPSFNFEFENLQLNVDQLRDMIYKEVMEYHQPKTFDAFLRPAPKEPPTTKTTLEPEQISLDMKPDTNTVKVNVDKLVPRSSADVEMLSAKVENVQKEAVQKTEPEKVKETMKSETKPQENKTVSSNTKELIKAALLNANLRKQRQESSSEESNKNKPITAAQRQREREEKRKKKKEKTLERMKKNKAKKSNENASSLLTNEDKEMLERWAKMQKNIQQIAPKPDPNQVQTRNEQTITIINIQQQVITIPKQNETGNQGQPKTETKFLGQKSLSQQHMFGIQNATGQRGSLPSQSDISKTDKVHLPPERRESDSCVYQMHRKENIKSMLADIQQQNKNLSEMIHKRESVPGFSTINMQDLKSLGISNMPVTEATSSTTTINMQDLKSLGISNMPVPEATSASVDNSFEKLQSNSNETLDNSNQNFTNRRSPFSQGSPLKDYSNNGSPESYTSQGSPENFLNTSDSSEHSQSNIQAPNAEIPNVSQNSQRPSLQNYQTINENVSGNLQTSDYRSNVQCGSINLSGAHSSSANISTNFSNQLPNSTQIQNIGQNFTNQPSHSFNANYSMGTSGEQPSFFSSSYNESFLDGQNFTGGGNFQSYERQHDHKNKLSRRSSCNQEFSDLPSCQYSSQVMNQYDATYGQGLNIGLEQSYSGYTNVDNGKHNEATFSSVGIDNSSFRNQEQNFQQDFSLSNSSGVQQQPDILQGPSINMPFQSYSSHPPSTVTQPAPSKQPALQINTNTPPDLISILSKQFSRSQVEDPCPPALALTPRGTGAGYGVGMDLDSLIMDSQDNDLARPEPSPLSSSLLTDWMEVTGDLNIDMDALEQELSLQSPMALSYSDLSLYTN